jgi:hypothetical protein
MSLQLQVRAIRATAASLLTQLQLLEEAMAVSSSTACDHPPGERDGGVATFDVPGRWMCRRCGFIGGERAAEE